MRTRWGRGFLRSWVVVASIWIGGMIIFGLKDQSIPSLSRGCHELREFTVDETSQRLGDADVKQCEAVWSAERLTLA